MPSPKDPKKLEEYKEKQRQHALLRHSLGTFGVGKDFIPHNKKTKIEIIDGVINKLCPQCLIVKTSNNYYKNKSAKDGMATFCKECKRTKDAKSYLKNRDHAPRQKLSKEEKLQNKRSYYHKNKKEINKKWAEKRRTDINLKLLSNLRSRLSSALKNNRKTSSTTELLGCNLKFLRDYLESKFTNDMSWDNYGSWHIDHIVPCCKFDMSKEEEQKKCFHYSNLQPLWAQDNLRKNKY